MQNDYIVVIDEKLLGFIERSIKREVPDNYQYILSSKISDKLANDIEELIGLCVKGYKNKITRGNDLSGEFKNSDGSPSKTIVLQGIIEDEFYYVVEAVPDSSRKTLYVTTAYINKNDTIAEAGDAMSLNPDVQDGLQSNVSSNIIISKLK